MILLRGLEQNLQYIFQLLINKNTRFENNFYQQESNKEGVYEYFIESGKNL